MQTKKYFLDVRQQLQEYQNIFWTFSNSAY